MSKKKHTEETEPETTESLIVDADGKGIIHGAEQKPDKANDVPKFIVKSDNETVEGEFTETEAHDIRRKREIVRPLDNWRVEPAK